MTRTTIKLAVASVVLLGAVGYLAFAGMKDGWTSYHVPVDQYVAGAQYRTQHVRLAGRVMEDGVEVGAGRLGVKFVIAGESQKLPVSYGGVVPDLFKGGCEVIVEGKMDTAGVFQAETLLTKCASKYEAKEHAGSRAKTAAVEGARQEKAS